MSPITSAKDVAYQESHDELRTSEAWSIEPPILGSDVVKLCARPGDQSILDSKQIAMVARRQSEACEFYVRGAIWTVAYFQDLKPTESQVFCDVSVLHTADTVLIARWIKSNAAAGSAPAGDAVVRAVGALYGCKR